MGDTRQLHHYQRDLPFGLGPDARPAAPTAADPEGALALLVAAAQEGHLLARSLLGRVLWSTRGREAEGVHWLREAAAAGETMAKHWLGLACFRGQGIARDLGQARRLQQQAAEQGVIDAQFELSLLLAQGLGGKVDAAGARRWELRAAQAGHPRACLNRGSRLAGGKRPAFAEAARWYARAAEGGNAEAAARLCKMHVAGQGVPRDEETARRWYTRAAALGYRWDDGDEDGMPAVASLVPRPIAGATMILLIGLYRDRAPARMAELLDCLGRNLGNPRIAEVHVFLEDSLDPDAYPVLAHSKVRFVPHRRRVTFRDLFAHANRALAGQRVIIANNDIYFDRTLGRLDGYDLAGKLLCLSRWEVERDGSVRLFEQPWSQDAWIFEAPVPAFSSDWHLGLPGCENRLAYEAQQAGLALLNPARTLRAHHLHHSQVRHYTERQRLPGHGRGVEATALGVPWLWPIVTCQGRLADLQETFGALMEQPRASPVLVDYDCPDGSGAWARGCHPDATVVAVGDRRWFNAAEARNLGAAAADEDAVLGFLDADVTVSPAFAEEVLARHDPGAFLVPDADGPGLDSALVCARAAFQRVGGYDTNYLGPGGESGDLRAALARAGLAQRTFPASLLSHRRHARAAPRRPSPLGDPALPALVDAAYRRLKEAIVSETGDAISRGSLREIQRAITHRHLVARGLIPEAPGAAVAFREAMGYTVACLHAGTSSHNNDPRPFEEIPSPLAGLAFTQVVASRVSPVRVEFRAGGKLYVLVGTDWYGYRPATAFLRAHGYREPVPDVRTRRGTAFEVWSLIGDAGDALDLPTQVMLVARQLVAA